MSLHIRVLRRMLLLGSVLTLTGIHHDVASLPAAWRLSKLLPISLKCVTLTFTLIVVAISQHIQKALVGLCLGIGIALGLLLLTWFLWRRRDLHHLLRQVEQLERDVDQIWECGDTKPLKHMVITFFSVSAVIDAGFMLLLSFKGISYKTQPFPMWVPAPLRDGASMVAIFILQATLAMVLHTELMSLVLLLAALADAAALHLRLLQRAVLNICRPEATDSAGSSAWVNKGQVTVTPARAEEGQMSAYQGKTKSVQVAVWPGSDAMKDSAEANPRGTDTAVMSDLAHQSERYRLVYQLVSDTADVFSAPLLWLHAAVAAILLLVGYVVAVQLSGHAGSSGAPGPPAANTVSLCLLMVHWFLCLSTVAVAGSRLMQQSEQLRDVVSKDCWSRRMSVGTHAELQVLLEQTRVPLALNVWGLFNVQKSVLLSVLSFVLTYFVIMLQMIR